MTKKNLFLMLVAIGLGVAYAIWFTDWFRPATLKIYSADRNFRAAPSRGNALPSLMFGVNQPVPFTELKVVPLAAYETNKSVSPVWHLVSDSNSVPVKAFFYGQWIAGMRPAIKDVGPEAIQPNVTYRLFITAGKVKGQHDFELK